MGAKRSARMRGERNKRNKEKQVDGVRRFVVGDEQIGGEMEKEKRGERWQRRTNRGEDGKEML